jgi:transposase
VLILHNCCNCSRTVGRVFCFRPLKLKRRRGHERAIIAIARMLLTAIYHNLKNKEPYNAELYKKLDVLPVVREITVEQAILLAKAQGYRIMSVAT